MTRATTHRSSEVEFNGKLLINKGGNTTAANDTHQFGHFIAPCDGTIVQHDVYTNVAVTHASANFLFGSVDDTDANVDDYDLEDVVADTLTSLMGHASQVSTTITKGKCYCWSLTSGDTTGNITTSVTIEPR